MAKRAQAARTAHTKQKPKPRYVSKAHQLEQHEREAPIDSAQRPIKRPGRK